jgi:hypothetical protein
LEAAAGIGKRPGGAAAGAKTAVDSGAGAAATGAASGDGDVEPEAGGAASAAGAADGDPGREGATAGTTAPAGGPMAMTGIAGRVLAAAALSMIRLGTTAEGGGFGGAACELAKGAAGLWGA